MWAGLWRLGAYVVLALLGVGFAALLGAPSHGWASKLGLALALLGFSLIVLQAILAARLKWIERAFGFDILIRFHRNMGILTLVVLVAHPLLLASGEAGWGLIFSLQQSWVVWVGKAALLLLIVHVLSSVYQRRLGLRFEAWRNVHDLLGPLVLGLGFVHSWFIGDDLVLAPMRLLWIVLLLLAAVLFLYHRFLRPWRLRRRAFEVVEVVPEAEDVWTVRLAPTQGRPLPDYLPGQFHFITFFRRPDLPVEEHHWTISSSPTEKRCLSSTIKALGDFTATMGETRVGDTAAVHAAFGRFSYVLHPQERDLVFIAGGIGITPLISMLRHMRDTEQSHRVLLIYGNQDEAQILFREELDEIASREHPRLRVVHVIDNPDPDWDGERGRIDEKMIRRLCGSDLTGKAFYLCGSAGLTQAAIRILRGLDVPDSAIRLEVFSFLD
ncbi:MAG: oxidoreductase [Candidatus Eisenbacteria bacterium]|nr:oxidoreductase [Candidatus Eisenbacteria bacterium]